MLGLNVTDEEPYKYDVAFSFLKEDESLAVELNDLIQDRVSTFLYSRHQTELAGTDGEKTFNEVFGKQARVVTILFRTGWGETPWTRIEETSIRNRAYDEGYDFVVVIPLDTTIVPKWLPQTRIWVGIDRWGASGAAAIIEARVQEAGGSPQIESVEDKAARLKRAIDSDKARKQFLNSDPGVAAAREETENLYSVFSQKAELIATSAQFPLTAKRIRDGLDVCASFGCLAVDWSLRYSHTLDQSKLQISLWNDKPPRPGRMYFDNPSSTLRKKSYELDRDSSGDVGWRESGEERLLSSDKLADVWLGILIEHAHDQHRKDPR